MGRGPQSFRITRAVRQKEEHEARDERSREVVADSRDASTTPASLDVFQTRSSGPPPSSPDTTSDLASVVADEGSRALGDAAAARLENIPETGVPAEKSHDPLEASRQGRNQVQEEVSAQAPALQRGASLDTFADAKAAPTEPSALDSSTSGAGTVEPQYEETNYNPRADSLAEATAQTEDRLPGGARPGLPGDEQTNGSSPYDTVSMETPTQDIAAFDAGMTIAAAAVGAANPVAGTTLGVSYGLTRAADAYTGAGDAIVEKAGEVSDEISEEKDTKERIEDEMEKVREAEAKAREEAAAKRKAEEEQKAAEEAEARRAAAAEKEASGSTSANQSSAPSTSRPDPDAPSVSGRQQEELQLLRESLGATRTNPKDGGATDPTEDSGSTLEFRDAARVPTSDDLAQPVPGEATVAAGDSDPDTSSGSSGWGTGAIDYGPDHVEIRTDGPRLEPDVPDLDATRDQEDDVSDE